MPYRTHLSRQAAADLQQIFEHVAKHSPQNAARVVDRILGAIDGLETTPHRTVVQGPTARDKYPVRSLPVQSWVVFFRAIDDQQVIRVLRIRHGARRRPRRFED